VVLGTENMTRLLSKQKDTWCLSNFAGGCSINRRVDDSSVRVERCGPEGASGILTIVALLWIVFHFLISAISEGIRMVREGQSMMFSRE
jgi:hypothetical protein